MHAALDVAIQMADRLITTMCRAPLSHWQLFATRIVSNSGRFKSFRILLVRMMSIRWIHAYSIFLRLLPKWALLRIKMLLDNYMKWQHSNLNGLYSNEMLNFIHHFQDRYLFRIVGRAVLSSRSSNLASACTFLGSLRFLCFSFLWLLVVALAFYLSYAT